MSEFEEKLSSILNNPDAMEQIGRVAQSLGLSGAPATSDSAPSEAAKDTFSQLSQALNQAENSDKKKDALLMALKPYLRPNHQARLDRACQIAKLSHFAGLALQGSTLFHGNGGGGSHV